MDVYKLVDTAEKAMEKDNDAVHHWQYRQILRDTLKKLEAIKEGDKSA